MATLATIANISQVAGVVVSPVLQVVLDQLLLHLSKEPSLGEQQQLGDALEDLKDAIESAKGPLLVAEDLQRENGSVAHFLRQLKDVLYDAEDLLDELEYEELRRKVEELDLLESVGGSSTTVQGSVQQSADGSTDATFLSAATNIAASLIRNAAQNIPNMIGDAANLATGSSSNSSPSPPTDATNQASDSSSSANSTCCSFSSTVKSCKPHEDSRINDIPGRIKDIIGNLNRISEKLEKSNKNARNHLQLQMLRHDPRNQFVSQNNRTTTPFANESKICGRDDEKKQLMKILLEPDSSDSISVFPILGMGGIGKTTLAQWAYNNAEAKKAFEARAWICVSDHYNYSKERIVREILEQISNGGTQHFTSPSKLEEEMVGNLRGKKFLLVLDDLWSHQWMELLYPLKCANAKFIKIVVTSRNKKVFDGLGKEHIIDLKPLENDDYWSLFLRCIFGDEDPDNYLRLHDMGREIMKKLKGSPLAAKTVGRLLRVRLDDEHWGSVLKSNLWELSTTDPNDIMPALALSYNHLSKNLQQCFAFCSVYPKDFVFEKKILISMWVAQGYAEAKTNLTPEEVGEQYFEELVCRCFFHKDNSDFKMHDLLHDLAQFVSLGECCIYDGHGKMKRDSRVRHLCISTSVDLSSICDPNKLRTLILVQNGNLDAHEIRVAKRLRALVIYYWEDALPDSNGGISNHLRCLDLSKTSIMEYPKSWCELYHLRYLFLPEYCYTDVPSLLNFINLRFLSPSWNYKITGIGRMTYLEKLGAFMVEKECGHEVGQLKNMNALGGTLAIYNLKSVESRAEASKANLKDKSKLQGLELYWGHINEEEKMYGNPDVAKEVLEGLEPRANLKELFISGYSGSTFPNWLSSLQNLQVVNFYACKNCARLPLLGQLPFLHTLLIGDMQVTMDRSSNDVVFPSLQQLKLERSSLTLVGVSASTAQGRCFFPRLRKLTTADAAPQELSMEQQSPGRVHNDFQLPSCIHTLTALRELDIHKASTQCLPGAMTDNLKSLEELAISECPELTSVGGLQALTSVRVLQIYLCSKFTSWLTEGAEQECLLPKLQRLLIYFCESLESLPTWLSHLPSLEVLEVFCCPKMRSLPDGGLPRSLTMLYLRDCDPGLIARCREEESPEWQMIQHIPDKAMYF